MKEIKEIKEILNSEKPLEEKINKINIIVNFDDEFDKLKKIIKSEDWPEAVLEFHIADETSEEDKIDRAEGIIDILIEDLKDRKFLDFGCGEGHCVKYSSEQTFSVGYDIVKTGNLKWEEENENFLLTTQFEKIKEKGPFDIVLVYDVLDHAKDPVDVLNKVSSVLSPRGLVYLRCHPWCGRHGGHCYRKLNKAFVHLVFSEEELKKLDCDVEFNNKILFPLRTYEDFIKKTDLKINSFETEIQTVEDFFKNNELVRNRILNLYNKEEWRHDPPSFQMSQCFVDYVLGKE